MEWDGKEWPPKPSEAIHTLIFCVPPNRGVKDGMTCYSILNYKYTLILFYFVLCKPFHSITSTVTLKQWSRESLHSLIKTPRQWNGQILATPFHSINDHSIPLDLTRPNIRIRRFLSSLLSSISYGPSCVDYYLQLGRMANGTEDLSQFGISKEEKDKLVGEVIRYMLFKTHQNSGCPIKREELTQLVTKNYHQRNLPASVINEAKEKLSSIFGYEMRELQRSQPSSKAQTRLSQQSAADSKSYILTSQLPPDVYKKYVVDVNTAHLTGFGFVIVSIVHLAGGKIPEESLWGHLRRLGLYENEESHPVFGNIKQALELLVQQRYLQKDKVNGPEGNTLYYELAERSLDGPVSDKVKEYISQIVNNETMSVVAE